MRALACCLLFGVAAIAACQSASGVYRPEGAAPAEWRINDHHTLVWNGAPYVPVGARLQPSLADIERAKGAGVLDVLLSVPLGVDLQPLIQAMEAAGMRYLIAIDSLAPGATGVAVEPQTYRVAGITEPRKIEFSLPGATDALAVLVTARDATVMRVDRVVVKDGKFSMDVAPPGSLEHVLLVYPVQTTQSHPDYWEGFDGQRDSVLTTIRRAKTGPGLRGVVNPMGEYVSLAGRSAFVPNGAYFQLEFRQYLEGRYRNLETALRAWAIGINDVASFEDLARLVPLWSGVRGIPQLWDPKTDRLYRANQRTSAVWADIQAVINAAAGRRFDRLCGALRQVADVPIIQEWLGWVAPYEAARPALNGVGMRAMGTTYSELAQTAARAASSAMRWTGPSWLVATDIAPATADPSNAGVIINDLTAMGARGFYFRGIPLDAIAAEKPDLSTADWSPNPLYYPESAANPASPQRLPAGRFWLPAPGGGNRIDLGVGFHAYRYVDKRHTYTAIWTSGATARVKLRLADPKLATFTTLDGSDPKVKVHKNAVELDLGPLPILVEGTEEIPIPELALADEVARFEALKKLAETMKRDLAEEDFMHRDAVAGFERTPGGSFLTMRRAYWSATAKLAPYVWVEAESTRTTNFSELMAVSGASNGGALALRAPTALDPRGYFAEYNVPVRAGDVEVWIAARIPADARGTLTMDIGGQQLRIEEPPVMPYGPGFAWYRLGSTALQGVSMKMTLLVNPEGSSDLQIDAIYICPPGMSPKGAFPPEIVGN
ncbi:MAG: hypothetical protein IT363_12575 [Methanoregulaceae archaeon]|nr:hypothetical protein [Methanoregulaceae archaeon]